MGLLFSWSWNEDSRGLVLVTFGPRLTDNIGLLYPLVPTYVAVPTPPEFVYSVVASWTILVKIPELICPLPVDLEVVV